MADALQEKPGKQMEIMLSAGLKDRIKRPPALRLKDMCIGEQIVFGGFGKSIQELCADTRLVWNNYEIYSPDGKTIVVEPKGRPWEVRTVKVDADDAVECLWVKEGKGFVITMYSMPEDNMQHFMRYKLFSFEIEGKGLSLTKIDGYEAVGAVLQEKWLPETGVEVIKYALGFSGDIFGVSILQRK